MHLLLLLTKLCPNLCDPMDYSLPSFPVPHHVSEFAQVPVRWISDAIQQSHPLSPSSFFPFSLSVSVSGFFPVNWLFASGGQSIKASASASVLPISIQGWFPLKLTNLISLHSKKLSRVRFSDYFPALSPISMERISNPHFRFSSTLLTLSCKIGLVLLSFSTVFFSHQLQVILAPFLFLRLAKFVLELQYLEVLFPWIFEPEYMLLWALCITVQILFPQRNLATPPI